MDESAEYVFELKEVLLALIKHKSLHDGVWALSFEFGMGAGNIGPTQDEGMPSAFIQIKALGLVRAPKEGILAMDASKVNPKISRKVQGKAKAVKVMSARPA